MSSIMVDDSEDVNDFLQRIKELGDKRDKEDEERNRKLEEEILQGRKERQARRAERARSISPTKSSPAGTPTTKVSSAAFSEVGSTTFYPSKGTERPREVAIDDAMERLTGDSSATTEISSPYHLERVSTSPDPKRNISRNSPSAAMPSRNSPLSWQRRPDSQSSDRSKSRPLSMVAIENAARSPKATPEPSSEPILSREQIAQSLASKDPAWFRQTADRGLNSPAYRKNQVEDENRSEHESNFSARIQMPGMSQQSLEPARTEESVHTPLLPSQSSVVYGSGARAAYRDNSKLSGSLGSPMPLTPAQIFDPPTDADSESRGLAMSPTQGRILPDRMDRPISPTKGMGGFVQSAMMKRSDSVNKRWSVQSPTGLSRADSVASNRGSVVAARESKPSNLSRENSPHPNSRPTSSHSNSTYTHERPGTSGSMRNGITISTNNHNSAKPFLPASHTQAPLSVANTEEEKETSTRTRTPPPRSPSKAAEPSPSRRWSPTKSSWLESALNKPESPKPIKNAPSSQQPSWMSDINKARQKASFDLGKNPTLTAKHEVSVGGLMRSPPLGGFAKPLSIGGLPSGFSSGAIRSRAESLASQENRHIPKASPTPTAPVQREASKSSPSPLVTKPKPETPPKKDFRAGLKPRTDPTGNGGASEPEFRNALGQLRRTKTQNYVAPDELKDNITRGKMALNITGGPKKTQRVDEFKESILKKKEDFKKAQLEGNSVLRVASDANQEAPLPEALAKRQTLGRSGSIVADSEVNTPASPPRRTEREFPMPHLVQETSAPGRLQGKEAVGGKLAGRLNPTLAGLLARGPQPPPSDTSRSSSPNLSQRAASTSTAITEASAPTTQLTHMTKARARGPKRKAPTTTIADIPTTIIAETESNAPPDPIEVEPRKRPISAPTDTHFKPKERAELPYKSKPAPVDLLSNSKETVEAFSLTKPDADNISQPSSPRKLDVKRRSQFLQDMANKNNRAEPLDTPKPVSPIKKANFSEMPVKPQDSKPESTAPPTTPKPNSLAKSPAQISATSDFETHIAATRPLPLSSSKLVPPDILLSNFSPILLKAPSKSIPVDLLPKINSPAFSKTFSKRTVEVSNQIAIDDLSSVSVRDATTTWGRPSAAEPSHSPVRTRSPIKLPNMDDETAAMVSAGLRPASSMKKNSIGVGMEPSQGVIGARPLPNHPNRGPLSPPASAKILSPIRSGKALDSPASQTSDTSLMLDDFFGKQRTAVAFKVDTSAILSARPNEGMGIKTIRSTVYQLSRDGKKQLVPTHQERDLFQNNLYLCIHFFKNASGRQVTEVYFWVGDDVSKQDTDEVAIFAQREAKSAGGKLITIYQGHESPEFFHALGGIIIIRRGSANKYDSLAPHILCGRKQFGQIVFDEVDFTPATLCSGFPYLISTQTGKSYLWKGKGSGVDELSCARLIGMETGLTGEIEEVEDGREPESFLRMFGHGIEIPKSADHWRMKPNYAKYCVRLFTAASKSNSQINELSPFSQKDLACTGIFIIDAFFEIYIVVGSSAQPEYAAFHTAMMFAQEYGILAAGMEDRPFVPVTTVVLEGIPKDLKSIFRKWEEERSPTIRKEGQAAGDGLQRGRSLRVVPLTVALEAMR